MTTPDAPVAPAARYDSLDLLRGIAVLMIFSVNIRAMLQPFFEQGDPTVWGGPHDLAVDRALQFVVDGKWIAVFALLFGAGLMLLHEKAATAGAEPQDRIVRRQAWLIGFGLVHMVFIWLGDILVSYGVVGLVAMTLLGRRTRTVALWAAGSFAIGLVLLWGSGAVMAMIPAEEVAASPFSPAALVEAEMTAKAGSIVDQLNWRAGAAALLVGNVLVAGPMVLSYMLVGVLAFRSGFLLARWPVVRYVVVGVTFLATAWAIDAWRVASMGVWDGGGGDYDILVAGYMWVGLIEGLIGGLSYAALVNAAVAAGLRFAPLSAAGRMAFSNYIACSVIGTTLAAGHGAGLLGEVTLVQAMIVVGLTWLAILVVSPLWLRAFRYGPLEWLWRSLVYGERQPFLNRSG